jgi:hypothetical protein
MLHFIHLNFVLDSLLSEIHMKHHTFFPLWGPMFTVYILKLCNTVNERGWSSFLKWSEFEAPFKPSYMRPCIKAHLKFLWNNFEQGVGRTKLFRMKGWGVRNTDLLSISNPVCYGWLQFPYLSQKLHYAERWFTSVKICTSLCLLTMAVKSLLILHQMSLCFSFRDAFNKKLDIPLLNHMTAFTFCVSKSLNMPQDKKMCVYNLCPTPSQTPVQLSLLELQNLYLYPTKLLSYTKPPQSNIFTSLSQVVHISFGRTTWK